MYNHCEARGALSGGREGPLELAEVGGATAGAAADGDMFPHRILSSWKCSSASKSLRRLTAAAGARAGRGAAAAAAASAVPVARCWKAVSISKKDLVGIEVGLHAHVVAVHLVDIVLALSFALPRHQVHQFSPEWANFILIIWAAVLDVVLLLVGDEGVRVRPCEPGRRMPTFFGWESVHNARRSASGIHEVSPGAQADFRAETASNSLHHACPRLHCGVTWKLHCHAFAKMKVSIQVFADITCVSFFARSFQISIELNSA